MFEADDTSDEGATFVSHHPPGAGGRVLLAESRSYCAGVDRAIMIVERALDGEVQRFARDGRTIILIGHAEHEEVEGTYGEAPDRTIIVSTIEDVAALDLPRDTPVAYTTQTTLSLDETAAAVVDALRDRFDDLIGPGGDDICYASQNRQNAIKAVADRTDLVLVIGSANSSNSDPAVSRWIADCKSGRYSIQRPLQLGAAIAGRHDLADAFATYGHLLGEAFQLRDDLIDAFGDSAESGKPTGLDFADHKMTLLMALAAERDERVMGLLAAGRSAELRQLLERIGIRGEVEGRIDQLVGEARRAAMRMEIPPGWRRELAVMADRVAYRAS